MSYVWRDLRSNPDLKDGDLVECVSTNLPSLYKSGATYRVNFSRDGQRACVCSSDPMGSYPDYTGANASWRYAETQPKAKKKGFAAWVRDHA